MLILGFILHHKQRRVGGFYFRVCTCSGIIHESQTVETSNGAGVQQRSSLSICEIGWYLCMCGGKEGGEKGGREDIS